MNKDKPELKNILEKDKHELPDASDSFAAQVKRGAKEKKQTGVIFGANNQVISRVDTSETGSVNPPDSE